MTNELYHHGIRGQKWGKRNGPPYPLDPSDHSAAEKKASRFGSSAGSSGGSSSESKSSHINKKKLINDGEKLVSKYIGSTAQEKYEDKWLEKHYKKWSSKSDQVVNDDELGFEKIKNSKSPEEEIDEVNPFFRKSMEYKVNCVNCTLAYELRLRGLDVRAKENGQGMTPKEVISYFDKDFKKKNVIEDNFLKDDERLRKLHGVEKGSYIEDKIVEKISKSYPPNSRGAIYIPTKLGAHAMTFMVDNKGKAKILNPQDPSLMSSNRSSEFHNWLSYFDDSPRGKNALNFTMMRYDNAKFKSDANRVVNKVTKHENAKSSARAIATTFGPFAAEVALLSVSLLLPYYIEQKRYG